MAVKIGSDISGLTALRALNGAADSASRLRERLATGMRINRASDDAALLAVSEGLKADSRIIRQGNRNISDGLSLVAIADSALASIAQVLTRMTELAEQAGNGVYSREQRGALNAEYQSLSQEIERISKSTEFNGINLLNGGTNSGTLRQLTSSTAGYGVTYNYPVLALTGDGRTAIVHNSNNQLQYIDTVTGATTLIANTNLTAPTFSLEARIATDATGDLVAFVSADNLTGQNSSGFDQVYTYNRQTGQLQQITQALGAEVFLGLAVSADGSTVAFDSLTSYGSTSSYGTTQQIYTYNTQSGALTNMGYAGTNGAAALFSLSADGSWLTFQSTINTGQNADANLERWVVNTQNPSSTLRQVTVSTGPGSISVRDHILNNGDLYFSSSLDHVGNNSQLAGQIFKYSASTNSIQQLSNISAGLNFSITGSNDGRKINFIAFADPEGGALLGGYGAFSMDTATNNFDQLILATAFTTGQGQVVSADGTRVVLLSQDNPNGQNADGNWELFSVGLTKDQNEITIDTGQGSRGSRIAISLQAVNEAVRGLGGYVLTSGLAARGALRGLRENIAALSELRGEIGAAGTRLETSHRLGQVQALEFDAANSRIRDADIALTMSELVASQIRQKLALSVVAQVNQQSSIVLKLLNSGE